MGERTRGERERERQQKRRDEALPGATASRDDLGEDAQVRERDRVARISASDEVREREHGKDHEQCEQEERRLKRHEATFGRLMTPSCCSGAGKAGTSALSSVKPTLISAGAPDADLHLCAQPRGQRLTRGHEELRAPTDDARLDRDRRGETGRRRPGSVERGCAPAVDERLTGGARQQ